MFIYLFQNSCIRPVAMSCKRLYFISGMDVINDLCFCVLHLKLWMLALIQGLALQSQGSFSFTKEGSYTLPRQRNDTKSCHGRLPRHRKWLKLCHDRVLPRHVLGLLFCCGKEQACAPKG